MANQKLIKVIDALIAKNLLSELKWEKTINENIYQISLASKSIQISRGSNYGGHFIKIALLNEFGELIEEITDDELTQAVGRSYWEKLNSLYETARRSALGIDKALDDILDELSELDDEIPF